MTTKPSNLKSEALSILAEIPHTFIQLANTDSVNAKHHFITSLRSVHLQIATAFGEPRPANIGVIQVADDLTRWVNVWTWHPHASRWVADLRHHLHVAGGDTSDDGFRWIEKPDAVCPACLSVGCLQYQETTWDHRCTRTGDLWEWKNYRNAVKEAARAYQGRAA